jgi:hypothetical protein
VREFCDSRSRDACRHWSGVIAQLAAAVPDRRACGPRGAEEWNELSIDARYLVERRYGEGISIGELGVDGQRLVTENNTEEGVTWLHSYFSQEKRRSFCVYDAPSPEAIRRAAIRNGLPSHDITEVLVVDPYAYC